MRIPKFIKKNDTIGFVAPSYGCATEPYKTAFSYALDNFKNMGFKTELGPNCYASDGIGISSTPKNCGSELTQMYVSGSNDCLISCGGGELMCTILDYVDFEAVKNAEPKWYMGYSDNTNFTFLLTTICDVASVYGPCASTFGMNPWHQSLSDSFGILTGETKMVNGYVGWERDSLKDETNPAPCYNITRDKDLILANGDGIIKKASENPDMSATFSGRLIGGCMDCLVNLLGTKFDYVKEFNERYKDDKKIWFLEACDLNPMGIRRAMWQMDKAGWFDNVAGFIIGRPVCMDSELLGMDQYKAVIDEISKYNVPVIMDADLGHLPPAMPIISGAKATVGIHGNDMSIEYNLCEN